MNLKLTNRSLQTQYALSFAFLSLIIIAYSPILFNINELFLAPTRNQFKIICHQELERFFNFKHCYPLICARCSGIYFAAVFVPFFSVTSIKNITLLLLGILSLSDKVFELLFNYSSSNELRFLAGILFGGVLFYFLIHKLNK